MAPMFHKLEKLPEVLLIECDIFNDHRGFFLETYHQGKYGNGGVERSFVQDNHSRSTKGVLRGLHYQLRHPQAKLVTVISGTIFDVAVDIRVGSPTFGVWDGVKLTAGERYCQLFVPEGFAHGFCVLSDTANVLYKCTALYDPTDDKGILWADPTADVRWPVTDPILSDKDAKLSRLASLSENDLPRMGA